MNLTLITLGILRVVFSGGKSRSNAKEVFWIKNELLNFKITLPLAKLVMVEERLTSNA